MTAPFDNHSEGNHSEGFFNRALVLHGEAKAETCLRSPNMLRSSRLSKNEMRPVSKKLENHEAAIALHHMHYNFCCIHQTLRVTPAMEAGVADHVWSLDEVIGLMA